MTYALAGYYGFRNAGDEALLAALLAGLRRADPEAVPLVLSADPGGTAREHGVTGVPRSQPAAVWRALRRSDVLVFGGGSLLQDVTGPLSPFYYLALIALARWAGCPVVLHAQGFGPLQGRPARVVAARLLARCTAVTARDPAAAAAFAELLGRAGRTAGGASASHPIPVVPDPAFGLAPPDPETLAGVWAESGLGEWWAERGAAARGEGRPVLGVAVRPWTDGERAWPVLAQAVRRAAAAIGARVLLIPFQGGSDAAAAQALARLLGGPGGAANGDPGLPGEDVRVALAPVPAGGPGPGGNPALSAADGVALHQRAAALVGGVDLLLGMRLHALAFAAMAGTPAVALSYDPKVTARAHALALPCLSWEDLIAAPDAAERLTALLLGAWAEREARGRRLRGRAAAWAAESRTAVDALVAVARGRTAILGFPIDRLGRAEALDRVESLIAKAAPGGGGGPGSDALSEPAPATRLAVTANPEVLMRAREDAELAGILHQADLVVADGIGLVWGARLLGDRLPERIPGIELVEALIGRLGRRGGSAYFCGAAPGVAEEAAARLLARCPGWRLAGTQHGYFTAEEEPAVVAAIRRAAPDLLLVGLGAPRQEKWIWRHRLALGAVVAIGVGGSFDVFAGRVRRAPSLWRRMGLEWAYRLLSQPARAGRMLALPRFAWAVWAARRRAPARRVVRGRPAGHRI